MKTLILLFLSFSAFAQDSEIEKAKAEQQKLITQKKEAVQKNNKKIEDAQKEIVRLDQVLKERPTNLTLVESEISQAIKDLPIHKRLVSKTADFYRCLRLSLEQNQVVDVDRCQKLHKPKIKPEELNQVNQWKDKLSLNEFSIKQKQAQLKSDITNTGFTVDYDLRSITAGEARLLKLDEDQYKLDLAIEEKKLLEKNSKYTVCDETTPTINLEEKVPYPGADFEGPFVGIPRDNQDGLGTCYANAAKNLLVGASKGEDVASFLDMALAFKNDSAIVTSSIEGGHSCSTLKAIQDDGYCPQEFSPIETGEINYLTVGLMGNESDSVYDQSRTIKMLHNFIKGQDELKKSDKVLAEDFAGKAKIIIDSIKSNPNIKLPMPVVRHSIPADWKLGEAYHLYKDKIKIPKDKFIEEYKNSYKKFYPHYVNAVLAGKNADQIFDIYQEKMKDFFTTHQLDESLAEFKRTWKMNVEADMKDPNLAKSILASLNMMKIITNKEDATHDEFMEYCQNSLSVGMEFISALQPLVDHLNSINVSTDNLFDDKGRLRNPRELMQLAVAPACLNKSNRKAPKHNILCEAGYGFINALRSKPESVKAQAVRNKVVASLLQGYPLGNTFATFGGNHINTIVGMRYSKEDGKCQYLIRESQSGTSIWQNESYIVPKMDALTEVRRK